MIGNTEKMGFTVFLFIQYTFEANLIIEKSSENGTVHLSITV